MVLTNNGDSTTTNPISKNCWYTNLLFPMYTKLHIQHGVHYKGLLRVPKRISHHRHWLRERLVLSAVCSLSFIARGRKVHPYHKLGPIHQYAINPLMWDRTEVLFFTQDNSQLTIHPRFAITSISIWFSRQLVSLQDAKKYIPCINLEPVQKVTINHLIQEFQHLLSQLWFSRLTISCETSIIY